MSKSDCKTDDNSKAKRIGPPPIRHGVDYINPKEEDQMVIGGQDRRHNRYDCHAITVS